MDRRRARPHQARVCRQADPPPEHALVAGRRAAHGMGKQYPGEQLPRWALHCHWRADGEPVWTNPALLADPDDDTDTATPGRRQLRLQPGRAPAGRSRPRLTGLRGRPLLPVARAPAAGQRARRGRQAARSAGARPLGPRVRPGPGAARWQRAAAAPGPPAAAAAGSPASGACATASCSWCPATARSACACRWTACPGPIPTVSSSSSEPDPFAPRATAAQARLRAVAREPRVADVRPGRGAGGRARASRTGPHRACGRSRATACCTSSSRRSTRSRTG